MLSNTEIQQPIIKLQFLHSMKYAWIVLFPMLPLSAFLFDSISLWLGLFQFILYYHSNAEQILPQSEDNLSSEDEKNLKDSFLP